MRMAEPKKEASLKQLMSDKTLVKISWMPAQQITGMTPLQSFPWSFGRKSSTPLMPEHLPGCPITTFGHDVSSIGFTGWEPGKP